MQKIFTASYSCVVIFENVFLCVGGGGGGGDGGGGGHSGGVFKSLGWGWGS